MKNHGCSHCQEVNQDFRIEIPADLERAIRIAATNIQDGRIQESNYWPKEISNCCDSGPFSDLANGKLWGDIVEYYFECIQCKSLYRLFAETYHGSGGGWSTAQRL